MGQRVVVITGASSGIGAALAAEVFRRGGRPVLAARREIALADVSVTCGDALVVPTDVTKRADVEHLVARTLEHHGHIDAFVNNAGRGITCPVSLLTDEDIDEMVAVNLKSALYGMQAVLRHFKARQSGHIVNVSSMLGRVPFAFLRSAYSAAKHGLNALTANLRMELALTHPGIRVSLFSPGVVATDFGDNSRHGGLDSHFVPDAQDVDEVARLLADILDAPRADVYSRPDMQARAVEYYAAPDMGEYELGFLRR